MVFTSHHPRMSWICRQSEGQQSTSNLLVFICPEWATHYGTPHRPNPKSYLEVKNRSLQPQTLLSLRNIIYIRFYHLHPIEPRPFYHFFENSGTVFLYILWKVSIPEILCPSRFLKKASLLQFRFLNWQPTPVFLPGEPMDRGGAWYSMGSQRVWHDWATNTFFYSF